MQKIEQALGIAVANMMFSTLDNKKEMMQTIHEAHDELSEIKELLKSVEFVEFYHIGTGRFEFICPFCRNVLNVGHKPDCKLAKFIGEDHNA